MPTPPVLVVDDSLSQRIHLAHTLHEAGFEVREAATGAEALRLAAEHRPHLVVLDVVLPDIQGYEVCRRLKADPATAACLVLMLSGVATRSGDRVLGLGSGADGYLVKP